MKNKSKDIIKIVLWSVVVFILATLAILGSIPKVNIRPEIPLTTMFFWGWSSLFLVFRPLERLTKPNGYDPLPSTQEEWIDFYKKTGFNLAGMQIMPEGVKMLFNGENIELTCANIDFKFVLSLEKCEQEPS